MVHLLRPSGRGLEAVAHVTSDTSAPERALLCLINPTGSPVRTNVTLPLYYAGLPPGARVTVRRVPVGLAAAAAAAAGVAAAEGQAARPRDETHVVGADGAGFTDVVRPAAALRGRTPRDPGAHRGLARRCSPWRSTPRRTPPSRCAPRERARSLLSVAGILWSIVQERNIPPDCGWFCRTVSKFPFSQVES
jgi:hypothetical protein